MATYQSKSKRLAEILLRDVEHGNFDQFPHMPSELRLSELYGAARATVRKALWMLEARGVFERRQRHLHLLSKGGRSGAAVIGASPARRYKIAGIFAQEDALINGFIAGISKTADELNMDFRYFLRIPENPKLWTAELAACNFDGLLLMPIEEEPYRKFFECAREARIPLVCLDRCLFGYEELCTCVEADNRAGVYRAVVRLINQYQRPVHFFSYPLKDSTTAVERYDGFCNAMCDAGFQGETESCSHFFNFIDLLNNPEQNRLSGALRELRKLTPPVSIFALNDYAAYAVYLASEALGWRIGDDVAIISFDDSPLSYRLQPRLSGLHQPLEEIGSTAVELLHRMMAGEVSQPMRLKIPVTLIEKESSLPPVDGEPELTIVSKRSDIRAGFKPEIRNSL